MLAKIGALVAAERSRQGLHSGDLGVDAAVVEALERGQEGITTIQLETVADSLQLDPFALRRGELVSRPVPSVYLRHHAVQDFDTNDLPIIDDALEQARDRNVLSSMVGADLGLFPQGAFVPRAAAADSPTAPALQGYQLAREVRQALKVDADPFGDLCELAEVRLGVTVVVRSLTTLGSSAISVKAGTAATVVLTPGSTRRDDHVRGCTAHELCHILFDPDNGAVNVVVDFDADQRALHAEQRARAFVAEFLVPDAGVRNLIGPPRRVTGNVAATRMVAAVRDVYGASWPITANHLCNLGFIDSTLRDWLVRSIPGPTSRPATTILPADSRPSLRVEALTRRAHEGGYLTDGEARGLLGLDPFTPLPWEAG